LPGLLPPLYQELESLVHPHPLLDLLLGLQPAGGAVRGGGGGGGNVPVLLHHAGQGARFLGI